MYGEDVEVSYRLRAAGYQLKYCPRAVVWHYSYAHPEEIKPAQYVGSITGNLRVRFRYGSIIDRLVGLNLVLRRLLGRQPYPGARMRLAMALLTISSILLQRTHPRHFSIYFPFRGFDYELTRRGAFVEAGHVPADGPLVSVIMRTQGRRKELLRQAAQTVMHQTYRKVELILVEDGNNALEGDVAALREVAPFPVRYYPSSKMGRSAAGNEGLRQAQGEFDHVPRRR